MARAEAAGQLELALEAPDLLVPVHERDAEAGELGVALGDASLERFDAAASGVTVVPVL